MPQSLADGHSPARPASIRMIWAQSEDGVIGDGDRMPWHIPEDLARFREVTMDAPVIMGRRTWDSLPERFRPLPGRRNIVLSRSAHPDQFPGAELSQSLESAFDLIGDVPVAWIMGGGRVYRDALGYADECLITEVDGVFDIDTPVRAPEMYGWRPVEKSGWHTSESGVRYRFTRWMPRDDE